MYVPFPKTYNVLNISFLRYCFADVIDITKTRIIKSFFQPVILTEQTIATNNAQLIHLKEVYYYS